MLFLFCIFFPPYKTKRTALCKVLYCMMKVLKVRGMEVCFIMVQKFMHTLDLFYPDKSFTGLQRPELSVQCITFTTDKAENFSAFEGDLYITC